MKFSLRNHGEGGQILVTTLVLSMVLGIALAASLNLVTSNNSYTTRSQVWNNALHVAEAGVEEAFAYINDVTVTNIAARNGFAWNTTNNAFYKSRTIDNLSYYEVYVKTNTGTNSPTITSTGYVQTPVTVGSGAGWLAAVSLPVSGSGVKYLSRTVQVTTWRQPSMPKGLVIKNSLDCKGNNVTVDSYDNDLGEYGVTIFWPLPVRVNISDGGDVAIGLNAANIGNANIKGHVWTGPTATVNIGPNGTVGSSAWVNASTKGIQSGWWRKDSNFTLPDVAVPWTGGAVAPSTTSGGDYVLNGGIYEVIGNLNLIGKQMFVKGDAALWVKGNVSMDSGSYLKMNGSGYRLVLYVSGTLTLSGTFDKSIDPKDLLIFGLPSCTSIDITTGSKMEAAIYAPNADANLKGTADLRGSLTAKSVTLTGSSSFHYDESLARRVPGYSYRAVTWREL
jgi:hypothetical protein